VASVAAQGRLMFALLLTRLRLRRMPAAIEAA